MEMKCPKCDYVCPMEGMEGMDDGMKKAKMMAMMKAHMMSAHTMSEEDTKMEMDKMGGQM